MTDYQRELTERLIARFKGQLVNATTQTRSFIGSLLIRAGMAIVPADVRAMLRGILLYHVPGMLTEQEKADIRAAKMLQRD